jgi:DNA polymerase III subunit alpha
MEVSENSPVTPFVHLHLHSQYSLLDGAIRIEDLVAKAKQYQMPALAITDHGNMFGAVEFYLKCKKAGIKPIIGCELYIAPDSRFSKDSQRDFRCGLPPDPACARTLKGTRTSRT